MSLLPNGMLRLKVLRLEEWMKRMKNPNSPSLQSTDRELNRDGYYLNEDSCWFEVDGTAYFTDRKQFLYTLGLMNAKERVLRQPEEDALKYLRSCKIGNNSSLLYDSRRAKADYSYGQRVRLHFYSFKKKAGIL